MKRLDIERQKELTPKRMQYAINKLQDKGIEICHKDYVSLSFKWKGSVIVFYPYSGWHTGKTIQDGRGIDKLLIQLK